MRLTSVKKNVGTCPTAKIWERIKHKLTKGQVRVNDAKASSYLLPMLI